MDAFTIQSIIARYVTALQAGEAQAVAALQSQYRRLYDQLRVEQDALLQEMDAKKARGEDVTANTIRRSQRYERLIEHTRDELDRYSLAIDAQVTALGVQAADLGSQMADELLQAMLPPEVYAAMDRVPVEAIRNAIAALQRDSPLWRQTLAPLGDETARGVGDALVRNILAGRNPVQTAYEMANVWGVPLTRAMTIARTEQLRAHRYATLEQYRASNVVQGWQWFANLDTRTCMSCVAKHGEIFTLGETMDDHCNGRCVMMPVTPSWAELGFEGMMESYSLQEGDGERWFESLDEATQVQMMGPGRYELWRNGGFDFDALSKPVYDRDWGRMFVERPLHELQSR